MGSQKPASCESDGFLWKGRGERSSCLQTADLKTFETRALAYGISVHEARLNKEL